MREHRSHQIVRRVTPAVVSLLLAAAAFGQDASKPAGAPPALVTPAARAPGILPIADYTGDIWTRSYLAGDLGGARTRLANKGLSFDVDWTQVVQGVVKGGRNIATEYGGTLDYNLKADLDRMGVMPGGIVTFKAETRYGVSVNADAGTFTPVNVNALFPLTHKLDDDVPIVITNLNYTQFLSEHFALVLGKFDTFDGDGNEFASGRGTSQFMNFNMVANGVTALGMPYSTLGITAVYLPNPQTAFTITAANASDSSTTSGFQDFGEGYLIAAEAKFQYKLGTLPGGITAGGYYVGDADFANIGSRVTFAPGEGLTIPRDDSLWALYINGWQYLTVSDDENKPINVSDGRPDRKGLGIFARAGVADDDTDPVSWALSGGLGGRGLIPSRENDVFGVGYFYNRVATTRLTDRLGVDDHNNGFETFYNLAVTPATMLTFDLQYVEPALPNVDPALVLGLRLNVRF